LSASIVRTQVIHSGWTTLMVATIRDRNGSEFNREIEDHGQAVGVLPYDPGRRVALLVRLARAPVLYAGESGELLEAPAGMIEDGDGAEETVRREAFEEAGLRLGALEPVARAWSSPGLSTERIALFLAPYSAAERTGQGGGLESENENITVVEVPLAELWSMVELQELTDLKTLAMVLALKVRQPQLFD